jgi:hypothetical protein
VNEEGRKINIKIDIKRKREKTWLRVLVFIWKRESRPSLGHTTTNQSGGTALQPKPSIAAWQPHESFASQQFSIAKFYHLVVASLA